LTKTKFSEQHKITVLYLVRRSDILSLALRIYPVKEAVWSKCGQMFNNEKVAMMCNYTSLRVRRANLKLPENNNNIVIFFNYCLGNYVSELLLTSLFGHSIESA